jgi:hypothetical protein
MKRPKHTPEITAGLQQIDQWGEWFTRAHTQRLRDLDLPTDQFERELDACRRQGEAITEQMRVEFLARPR